MLLDSIKRSKVRDENFLRFARCNRIDTLKPSFDINVRWRSQRRGNRCAGITESARIAGKGDAVALVEICDVMPSMSRSVGHFDRAGRSLDLLAALERSHILLRHRNKFTPQPIDLITVQACSTFEQTCGVHHVRRASLMHIYPKPGIFSHQRPGRTRMIEMNMGQENRRQVGNSNSLLGKVSAQRPDRKSTRLNY